MLLCSPPCIFDVFCKIWFCGTKTFFKIQENRKIHIIWHFNLGDYIPIKNAYLRGGDE